MRKKSDDDSINKVEKFYPNRIQKTDIKIPNFNYKVVAEVEEQTAFSGNVIVLPTVLLLYLRPNELRVAATILQEIMENGECLLTAQQFCIRLQLSLPTIHSTFTNLRKLHVMKETRKGWKIKRKIDFEAVQHFNDLVAGEDRGIFPRLRNRCRLKNIAHITRKDVEMAYDKYVLPPDHDIEEEEEYD